MSMSCDSQHAFASVGAGSAFCDHGHLPMRFASVVMPIGLNAMHFAS
jgi:hypothetical protein